MVSTTVHDRTDHQHRDLPTGSCCGARGLASATMAAAILDPLRAPDVRELVSPKDSAAPRGGRRLAGSDSVDLLVLGSIAISFLIGSVLSAAVGPDPRPAVLTSGK